MESIQETKKPKTIAHLCYVPFTGLGRVDRGDEWLKRRIEIFKHYVLNALCNQTNLHFTLWMSWRPEDEKNPIVQQFYKHLNQVRSMSPVFTYDGLCFWDDKYTNWHEAGYRLLTHLKNTLPKLKQHVEHADEVLLTIQPSDDMYLAHSIQQIQDTDFGENKAIGWTKGYIINYGTKEIAEYNPETIPPFFTIRFPTETFLDPRKHYDWTGPYRSHEYVKNLGFKELEGRGFVVGTHGSNISTTWNIPYKGKSLSKEEQEKVLLLTGTFFTEPIKHKQSGRLLLRKLLNYLPFSDTLRNIYYKLNLNKHGF